MENKKEIKVTDIWNEEKHTGLKEFIQANSEKQTEERKLKNELLAVQYQIEDYIDGESVQTQLRILDFVKMYLKILNATQKKLAMLFEMKDSNLHKYLVGERKLNTTIVLKLSSFSHTPPRHWLRIQEKNELMAIEKEYQKVASYQKYDYRNLIA